MVLFFASVVDWRSAMIPYEMDCFANVNVKSSLSPVRRNNPCLRGGRNQEERQRRSIFR